MDLTPICKPCSDPRPLVVLPFSTERELARKAYAASLFSLTPDQIAEEEALYLECKRMEQQERTFRAERDELMKSLGGAATVVMAQIVNSSNNADKKRKEAAVEGAVVGPNGLTGNKKLDKATKAGKSCGLSRRLLPPGINLTPTCRLYLPLRPSTLHIPATLAGSCLRAGHVLGQGHADAAECTRSPSLTTRAGCAAKALRGGCYWHHSLSPARGTASGQARHANPGQP